MPNEARVASGQEFSRPPLYGEPTGPAWLALRIGPPAVAHERPSPVIDPPSPPIT